MILTFVRKRTVAAVGPISIAMLATPTLQDSNTADALATGTLSPTANALILVAFGHRAGTTPRTHSSVTASFSTVAGFTNILDIACNDALEDGTANTMHLSIWAGIATGLPGTGTVSVTPSGATFQRIVAVAEVINRLSDTEFAEVAAEGFSGTTISGSLSPSTTSTYGVMFGMGIQNSTTDTPNLTAPLVDIASSPFTTGAFEGAVGTYTGTPSTNTVELTNTQSGRAKGIAAVFFNGNAP